MKYANIVPSLCSTFDESVHDEELLVCILLSSFIPLSFSFHFKLLFYFYLGMKRNWSIVPSLPS